jgi:predicted AlkP superfamily pyrophosphatase or phosphodiesterase
MSGERSTVVPSTTATALTSICTSLTPAQHGVLGTPHVVGGEVLNVLRWSSQDARPPDPFDVQRTTFLEAMSVVTKSEFRNSGFSNAHLRGALHRLEHRIGAGRALRPTHRVRRSVRVRVLPGRRQHRARVRLHNGFYEHG